MQRETPAPGGSSLPHPEQRHALAAIGAELAARRWLMATSGNLSVVVARDPLALLISGSGKHKGELEADDFLVVGDHGEAIAPAKRAPSAETMLHVMLAQRFGAGAVLHTHSVPATVLSMRHAMHGGISFSGLEMLKAFRGITTHERRLFLPIFDNAQDIPALARTIEARLAATPEGDRPSAFLLRGHGLYAWGETLEEAKRHHEAAEFLLEVSLHGVAADLVPTR